jgi:hypothetical protein
MHPRMRPIRPLLACSLFLSLGAALHAQNTLKDGTSLIWDKEITVGHDLMQNDSVKVAALTVPVYEATASQVVSLLKTELPGASFKKQGKVLKAYGASFTAASSTPVDMLASIAENRKQHMSILTLALVGPGTSTSVEGPEAEAAVRDLAVKLNKAVVQQQIDSWKKQLAKADGKAEDAVKEHGKAQTQQARTRAKLEKSAKLKSKLQDEHAVLQREIDLYNQKWTLSQDQKDLKKLTKARTKITRNETEMAKAMQDEAETQETLVKNADELPDAQKEKEKATASQAEVQRTVDALQRKLENIR